MRALWYAVVTLCVLVVPGCKDDPPPPPPPTKPVVTSVKPSAAPPAARSAKKQTPEDMEKEIQSLKAKVAELQKQAPKQFDHVRAKALNERIERYQARIKLLESRLDAVK